jgi:hypothetical protein
LFTFNEFVNLNAGFIEAFRRSEQEKSRPGASERNTHLTAGLFARLVHIREWQASNATVHSRTRHYPVRFLVFKKDQVEECLINNLSNNV